MLCSSSLHRSFVMPKTSESTGFVLEETLLRRRLNVEMFSTTFGGCSVYLRWGLEIERERGREKEIAQPKKFRLSWQRAAALGLTYNVNAYCWRPDMAVFSNHGLNGKQGQRYLGSETRRRSTLHFCGIAIAGYLCRLDIGV